MHKVTLIFLSVILLLLNSNLFPGIQNDILPLGNSNLRYLIAQLEEGKIMETLTGKEVSLEQIIENCPDTDIFILGEFHDSYECHKFQSNFIEALFKKNQKIIVGLEFFQREDNKYLELWRKGEIKEKDLLEKTGWYERTGINYGYTRFVMDIVKKYGIKTIGLNVSRDIIHKVATKGFESLTEEEKKLFPGINITNQEHEYYIKTIFGASSVRIPAWFKNIYDAQKCWDIVMAESMKKFLSDKKYEDWKGIIIAGSAHVAYGLGIPFRYKLSCNEVKITTVVPVSASMEKEDEENPMTAKFTKENRPLATFSRGIADYVIAISPSDKDYFPNFGFTGKINEKGEFEITRVEKGSIAERNSFAPGDVIISIDGMKISSVEQLRLILSQKNWNDSATFEIRKKIEIKK